jgi:predicted adenylyl cyclase CyaB
MPSNIEIKCYARSFEEIARRAQALSDTPVETVLQEDIFFHTPQGRLKLRILSADVGQLIYYIRPNEAGPKRSDYHLSVTSDPGNLKHVLELAYGIRGIVRKRRSLYLVGQTRVHLDEVEGLGQFMELEVVLRDGETDAEGQAIAEGLLASLGVERSDLLEGAYIDLLELSDKRGESSRI